MGRVFSPQPTLESGEALIRIRGRARGGKSIWVNFSSKTLLIVTIFTILVQERSVKIVARQNNTGGIILPRLCHRYSGIFPAANVELAPMMVVDVWRGCKITRFMTQLEENRNVEKTSNWKMK